MCCVLSLYIKYFKMRVCFSREGWSEIKLCNTSHVCWYDTATVKTSVQPWVLLALGDSAHLHEYISSDQTTPRL